MTKLFQLLFPTKLTNFGRSLFYITNENDYIARLTRIDQIYTKEIDPERATRGTL
jgi:hypothetical protein